jgi:adenylate cyclase
VISRTSARQYKQTVKWLPQIRTELDDVDGVVEGTVRRSGDTVRITVKLIRAATDRNLWAHIYDGDMSRMFTLQQQIASDVAVAAGRRRPTAPRPQTINPKAYQAYLNGLSARGLQRHEGFRRAVGYLEGSGRHPARLCCSVRRAGDGAGAIPVRRSLLAAPGSEGEAAARKALQLDDNLPRAHRAKRQ